MGLRVYDYRTDVRNVLVTPQIRSRFLKMEPGQSAALHSHDLGHEIFLVLEGRAAFEIDGETRELGPGQLCVALADQAHSVRTVGNEPMTMYLSVTPHIQPTHTGRTESGERMPVRFAPSRAYDVAEDPSVSAGEAAERHVAAARALAEAAEASARVQKEMAARLKAGDADGARVGMWEALYAVYRRVYELGDAWNDLAGRLEADREA